MKIRPNSSASGRNLRDKSADVYLLVLTDKFRKKTEPNFHSKISYQKTGTVNLESADSAKTALIDSAIEKLINGRN